MINFNQYRSMLCLNGDLPSRDFFKLSSLPIIAADGAANTLMAMGIEPDWVVGDFDSVEPRYLEKIAAIHRPDQMTCDFQKCLVFLEEKNLLPTIVTGVNGGDLDHILKNVGLIAGSSNLLIAPPFVGWSMKAGESRCFFLPVDTKISIIGLPSAVLSSHGLKWELDRYPIQFPGVNSFYNRSIENSVELTVWEGVVVVLVYTDPVSAKF